VALNGIHSALSLHSERPTGGKAGSGPPSAGSAHDGSRMGLSAAEVARGQGSRQ
jgi:hypothetical protein